MMTQHILFTFALSVAATGAALADEVLKSPDGDIALTFEIRNGRPTYFVDFKGKQIIAPSGLGFDLVSESGRNSFEHQGKKAAADALSLKDGFELVKTERDSVDTTWQPVWGEESKIRDHYNEMAVASLLSTAR